ncbi:hypothetical protein RAMDARK_0986 [Rickettsia amblyommatis str. Darkwater]|uniref:Ankyrin repeat-containing protein n=2 Tax=Rickettsia amblyommatis TaxID=33989 RepID=H8K5P0_RICAG|nr:ankyrin repeat-containing protein [Rickettsia amblyommatis str. GAT-30V]KJV62295.1 hypothetical protein APHACPA_1318 [Rickettsia amblyommatis str. Ac/Pa]KJV93017.1 hypothetical protein RAMDARK_0986 [Rickettsia amblyommatis str. Darkwater]
MKFSRTSRKVAEYLISKGAAVNGNDGVWLGSPLYEVVSTLM